MTRKLEVKVTFEDGTEISAVADIYGKSQKSGKYVMLSFDFSQLVVITPDKIKTRHETYYYPKNFYAVIERLENQYAELVPVETSIGQGNLSF